MVTIRCFHRHKRAPIAEITAKELTTIKELKWMIETQLALEESCAMRLFTKWYIECALSKKLVEVTELDENNSLMNMGIEDYSEILLDGPLTDSTEGLGQALAMMGLSWKQQYSRVIGLLQAMVDGQDRVEARYEMDNRAFMKYRLIRAEEQFHISQQQLWFEFDSFYQQLYNDFEKGYWEICEQANHAFQRLGRGCFTIDRSTVHSFVAAEDSYTALRTGAPNNWATVRSSLPLTPTNHRWAVRIVEGVNPMPLMLGIVPRLALTDAKLDSDAYIGGPVVGGWSIYSDGRSYGDWQCGKFPFGKGDTIGFDFNAKEKSLTVCSDGRRIVGHIPSLKEGDALYPAFTLYSRGQKVEFTNFPE